MLTFSNLWVHKLYINKGGNQISTTSYLYFPGWCHSKDYRNSTKKLQIKTCLYLLWPPASFSPNITSAFYISLYSFPHSETHTTTFFLPSSYTSNSKQGSYFKMRSMNIFLSWKCICYNIPRNVRQLVCWSVHCWETIRG